MIPMHTVFFVMVVVFAFIGSLRGWAKELIVAFSVVLALFIEQVLTTMVPPIRDLWGALQPMSQFWIRLSIFSVIVLFGYASPTLSQHLSAKAARERLQDLLLGFFLGLLNGLLIVGTLWFYLDEAQYGVPQEQVQMQPMVDEEGQPIVDEEGQPVMEIVYSPDAKGIGGVRPPEKDSTAWKMLPYLPPRVIKGPPLYLSIALSFAFVIIVFI
ncbi:MAG TPA: hypothetical protein EYH27_04105 [Anaerolineales bacterium]|nr:hypothetical protein [Anaerolineae bacterium]HIP87604.1 hypothetical protein [Anaerolineales bacterium]